MGKWIKFFAERPLDDKTTSFKTLAFSIGNPNFDKQSTWQGRRSNALCTYGPYCKKCENFVEGENAAASPLTHKGFVCWH